MKGRKEDGEEVARGRKGRGGNRTEPKRTGEEGKGGKLRRRERGRREGEASEVTASVELREGRVREGRTFSLPSKAGADMHLIPQSAQPESRVGISPESPNVVVACADTARSEQGPTLLLEDCLLPWEQLELGEASADL